MDVKQECLKAIQLGLSKATLARMIGRDPSTIYKWLNGNRTISKEVENEVLIKLQEIKKRWGEINV